MTTNETAPACKRADEYHAALERKHDGRMPRRDRTLVAACTPLEVGQRVYLAVLTNTGAKFHRAA